MSSSKSYHHRYLLAGALSILKRDVEKIQISSVGICDDVMATLDVIQIMGILTDIRKEERISCISLSKAPKENTGVVQMATKLPNVQQNKSAIAEDFQKHEISIKDSELPNVNFSNRKLYHVRESGSTLRFVIPILIAMNEEAMITGSGSIFTRPLEEYIRLFEKKAILYHYDGNLPLELKPNQAHKLSGKIEISTDTSSQFLSGLLFAAPLLQEQTEIVLTSDLKSKNYIDITLDVLSRSQIQYTQADRKFIIPPNQKYEAGDIFIEGDYSSACFFIAAGILSKKVVIRGLNPQSLQGDKIVLNILQNANADIHWEEDLLIIRPSQLVGMEIDAEHIIDSVPILCVLFSSASGITKIKNVGRLRSKESDRIQSSCEMIANLGGKIEYLEAEDVILIHGVKKLKGGKIKTHHDHRIAMSACIAALICEEDVIIDDHLCINKSYSNFFEDFARLGGEYVI